MRNILLAVGVAGLLGLFSACSGKDHAGTLADSTSGGKASFGGRNTGGKNSGGSVTSPGGAGGDAEAGAGSTEPRNAPVVEITEPSASVTPEDGVLLGSAAHVVCTVIQ